MSSYISQTDNRSTYDVVTLSSKVVEIDDTYIADGVRSRLTGEYVRGKLHRQLLYDLVDGLLARGLVEVEFRDDLRTMKTYAVGHIRAIRPEHQPDKNRYGSNIFRL